MDRPQLVIVMPAYNEADCIAAVAAGWLAFLDAQFPDRGLMLVINDGSKDRTGAILDEIAAVHPNLRVIHQPNSGHGAAVLNGYRRALELEPEWIFQVDSDDQFVPADFGSLWSRRRDSRFITGYRKSRNDAFHRLVITRLLRVLNFVVFGCYLRDANIPYRLMHGRYLRHLMALLPEGLFAPNIFLATLAKKDGQNLLEIPVTHKERETGTVSIVRWRLIKACLRTAATLVAFRLSLRRKLRSLRLESLAAAQGER